MPFVLLMTGAGRSLAGPGPSLDPVQSSWCCPSMPPLNC